MATDMQISVVVNGRQQRIPVGSAIAQLLAEMELQSPAIAVEINAVICPSVEYETILLQEDDRIEIVSLVGGG